MEDQIQNWGHLKYQLEMGIFGVNCLIHRILQSLPLFQTAIAVVSQTLTLFPKQGQLLLLDFFPEIVNTTADQNYECCPSVYICVLEDIFTASLNFRV